MMEVLQANGVTTVGLLLAALIVIGRMFFKMLDKQEEERKERYDEMKSMSEKREKEILEELNRNRQENKEDKEKWENERKIEREEWLGALNENTKQLNNVADKMEVLPKLQGDMKDIQEDIKVIKGQIEEIRK